MAIHLGAVALIATLLPLIVFGGTPPTRPATLQFAFMYGVNSTLFDYDAVQLFAGLKAAEQVINSGDWLDNTTVSFTHVPFSLTWNATQRAAAVAAAISSGITGIVAADWVASGVAYAVSNGSVPVIASRSLSTDEFGDSRHAFVNSLRMPIDVQYRTMLNHALNDDTTQCSSFALLFRPFFPTLLSNFMATVAELQLQAPTIINLGANYLQAPDTASVLNQFYNSTVYPPRCTLIFAMSSDIQDLLVAFYNDTRVPRTMKYYSSDFGGKSSFVDPVLGTAPFKNLLFVTDAGNFMSTTNPNAIGYRSALSAWIASNPTLPPTLNASVGIDAVPNTVSYEGYMAGMMVGNVLMGTMNLTAGGWIDSIYSQTLFWIGDSLMGPFIKRCLANPLLTMPCFCNVGSATQFVLRVDNTTGRIGPLGGDTIQNRPSYLSSLPTTCYPDDSSLRTSVRIQLFAPLTMSAVSSQSYDYYYSSTRLQAETINAANSIPGVMLSVGYMNKFIVLPSDMSDAAAAFPRYMATRQATVILGNWFPPESITLPVVNFFTSPIALATDEPLSAPTQFTPYTWYFKPTLADVTHACVQLLASIYQPGGVLVTAISDDSVGFRLAEQSLNTLQFPLESGSGVADLTDAAALSTLIRSQLDAASGGKAIVLFVATLDTAGVVNVVNAASSATAAVIAAHSDGGAAAFASFAMVIATEMGNLYTAKFQMGSPSSLLRFPIYFSWQLMPFFETTNPARIAMMATMNTTDPAVVELQTLYASTVVMGLLSAAVNVLTSRPTAQNIMTALYSLGTISSNGVTVGPFRTDNCTADVIASNSVDRSCQCFKAMRTLHVYDYRGWLSGSSSYNPHFVWTMPTCGPLYKPLHVASQLNVAMVVGIAVPCGAAFLVGVGYFVLCHGRRSNRAAPKDPEVPFAMVFTDIQSSTSLWARAPEAMGPALEQHHELLRKLVGRHDGYEVKTIGDSFMVAFKKASDAARFALAIQTTLYDETWPEEIDDVYIALAQEAWQEKQEAEAEKSKSEISLGGGSGRGHPPSHAPQQWEDEATYAANWNGIRVRVGLHWGIGSVKLDPVSQGYDYYGTLVNTAARVEGVGNGGQVLVTKDMFDQLESESFDLASIDVVPMGPQPLRGLDAPVPLYQLSPMSLRTRQFAALRLDVEIELDDESSDAGTSLNDGSTQLSAADDTPEMHMDRLLRRAKDGAAHREYLWRVAGFLTTAFRTTTASWRKDTMKQLMKKWHVKPRVVPSGVKETADKTLQYDIIALSVKVGLAAEEAERASKRHNNDTRSIGASSRLSAGTNHEGLQIRRGSIRRFSNRSSHVEDLS